MGQSSLKLQHRGKSFQIEIFVRLAGKQAGLMRATGERVSPQIRVMAKTPTRRFKAALHIGYPYREDQKSNRLAGGRHRE